MRDWTTRGRAGFVECVKHHFTCKSCRSKWYRLNLGILIQNYKDLPMYREEESDGRLGRSGASRD